MRIRLPLGARPSNIKYQPRRPDTYVGTGGLADPAIDLPDDNLTQVQTKPEGQRLHFDGRTAPLTEADNPRLSSLHVSPYFRPAYGFGGPITVTDLLTSCLADSGCRVRVWTSDIIDSTGARAT